MGADSRRERRLHVDDRVRAAIVLDVLRGACGHEEGERRVQRLLLVREAREPLQARPERHEVLDEDAELEADIDMLLKDFS